MQPLIEIVRKNKVKLLVLVPVGLFAIWLATQLRVDVRAQSAFTDSIIVNPASVIKDTSNHPIGINTNYLMDDDANRATTPIRSTAQALKDMGVKYLRYPGGDKSDSYLWSVPPFATSAPSLARTGPEEWPSGDVEPNPSPTPGPNGYTKQYLMKTFTDYKIDPLDFDEFIAMARTVGGEPTVVINFDSQFLAATAGGTAPTTQQLLDTATNWVRYANIVKGYNVKYWEIGNESYLGSHNGRPTVQQYVDGLKTFSRAMKAVDPTIKIGANGNNNTGWWQQVLQQAGDDIDFLAVHTYPAYNYGSYDYYRLNDVDLTQELSGTLWNIDTYASPSAKQRLTIALTEFNAIDYGVTPWVNNNTLGKALVLFETVGQSLKQPRLEYLQLWNTRWVNNNVASTPEVYDALNKENSFLAIGKALSIWGNYILDRVVSTTSTNAVKSYASLSPSTGKLNIFLVNKELTDRTVQVTIPNYTANSVVHRSVLQGTGPDDLNPTWSTQGDVTATANTIDVTLSPVSITVLSLDGSVQAGNIINNPGFEFDTAGWVNWGNGSANTSAAYTGSMGQQIGLGDGGMAQIIYMKPNTEYLCEGWARVSASGDTGWLGFKVTDVSGVETKYENTITSTQWTKVSKRFTTPQIIKESLAYSWHSAGTGYLYTDDYSCIEAAQSPTLTPTNTPTLVPTVGPTLVPTRVVTPTRAPTPTKTPTPTRTPTPTKTPTPSPSPAPVSVVTNTDAYVNKSSANTNYGTASSLQTVAGTNPRLSYMKFTLPTTPAGKTIASVKLSLYFTSGSANAQNIKEVSDITWGEKTITYNNRPTLGTTVASFTPGTTSNVTKEVVITSYVVGRDGQTISLAIESTGTDSSQFSSKDQSTSSRKPTLKITYQ